MLIIFLSLPNYSLLDDHAVSLDGTAVYEVAHQIICSCLVEDSNLFLKFFMEQLTRENSVKTFQIIRKLIRFLPKLPQQAAFSLYNYIIGYIMFYVRHPRDKGTVDHFESKRGANFFLSSLGSNHLLL